jgi:hypothetical protein
MTLLSLILMPGCCWYCFRDPKMCSGTVLPTSFLREWMTNFTVVYNQVREELGSSAHSTKFIFHTEVRRCGMNVFKSLKVQFVSVSA